LTGYVDTSALAAYYCPEALSPAVERVLRKLDPPTISPLVEVEMHSALALKVREREFNATSASRILAQFRMHLSDGLYRHVPIAAREYAVACDWIARFAAPLRALDGLHLAAAFANDLQLLTTDKHLAQSAKLFGVDCKLIA
jgi:predicted nucleic acid-binding protein